METQTRGPAHTPGKTEQQRMHSARDPSLPPFGTPWCPAGKGCGGINQEMPLAPQTAAPPAPTARVCLYCTGAERRSH